MLRKKIGWIFLFLFSLSGLNLTSASDGNISFKQISLEEGLSQTYVYCIYEDSDGFMWFGTQDGLNKYDGYEFKVFRPDIENPYSVSHNRIQTIFEDSRGFLWVGTIGGGLNKFDRKTERFYHYRFIRGEPTSLSNDFVSTIIEDQQGMLWVATAFGLNRFDPVTEKFKRYLNIPGDESSLSHSTIRVVYEDPEGNLWVGTNRGLNLFDRESEGFIRYRLPVPAGIRFGEPVNSICKDHAGTMWVGTNSGLYLFEPGTESFIGYQTIPGDPSSLSDNRIGRVLEDHSGVLWVTTQFGLNQFDRRMEQFTRYVHNPQDPKSLSADFISSIYESRSGILWVGTNGGGVNKFDREGDRFEVFTSGPGKPGSLTGSSVFSIYQDSDGILWVGTGVNGLDRIERNGAHNRVTNYRYSPGDPTSISSNFVFGITDNSNDKLWVATYNGGLNLMDKKTGKFTRYRTISGDPNSISANSVRKILISKTGVTWIATANGLNRFNPLPNNFTRYRNNREDPNSLSNNYIQAMWENKHGIIWLLHGRGLDSFEPAAERFTRYDFDPDNPDKGYPFDLMTVFEDSRGIVWLGTFGGGLMRMDASTKKFTFVREKDGLPNDVVYSILEDEKNFLWLSTNKGISRFDPVKFQFKNYNAKDGLQSNEFNEGAAFRGIDGEMFFGGIKGFNAHFPGRIKDNPFVPPIVITEFSISNKPVAPGPDSVLSQHISQTHDMTLSYKDNVFSFQFVSLDFTIPLKNKYRYRMIGFDDQWNETTPQKRFATYTNLDPGDYVFQVSGSNNDGIWNKEGTSINITITPPVTRTWWFRLLVVLVILALVKLLYNRRVVELAQKTRLRTELQTARDAQMSIMPQSDPSVPGFEVSGLCVPATEVGGDFFDYLWLDEDKNRFGIAIGDVSGKSMKAAMTAVMSDGILFSKASENDCIREIMTCVNRPLYFKTDKRMFTALCLVSLNIHSKELIFTNAGLSYPLLKSDGAVTLIKGEAPQFPLGIRKDNIYLEENVALKTGDVVVFFTDGIPETQNSSDQFYDYEALQELMEKMDTASFSATEIKERIIADAFTFAGSAPQNDDMTVVVVKVL